MDRQGPSWRVLSRSDRSFAEPVTVTIRSNLPNATETLTYLQHEENEMSTKPIRVIQTSPSECKVDQPVVVVSRGAQPGAPDRLQFINLTKDDIEVFIPARVFS